MGQLLERDSVNTTFGYCTRIRRGNHLPEGARAKVARRTAGFARHRRDRMKKSIGLGIVLGLCLGTSSQVILGAPGLPNCDYCDCAISKAWRYSNTTGFQVKTTRPADNPDGYGDPVDDAKWRNPAANTVVYSALFTCQYDFHDYADDLTYNKWSITNASWNDGCQRLQGQNSGGWTAVAIGTGGSQDPLGTASRYYCGPQD
jgi:hypothetical protein